MSRLPPGLDEFGRRLEQAAAREIDERERERDRERPRRRRWRNLGLPVIAAVLAAAVSAGAVKLVDGGSGDPITPDRGDDSARLQAPRDPAVIVSSATDDPAGGPPWVVRVFSNTAGRDCVQIGRLRGGVFGQVQRGQFRPLPPSAPGTCSTGTASGPLVAVRRTAEHRTVVFGLTVDRTPVSVTVGDRSQRVRPAGLGAFVAVFEGATAGQPIVVRLEVNGRTRVLRL